MPANTTKNSHPTTQNNVSIRTNHVTLISNVAAVPNMLSAARISSVDSTVAFITVIASGTRSHPHSAPTDQRRNLALADQETVRRRHLELRDGDVRLVHNHAEDPRQGRHHHHHRDRVPKRRLQALAQRRLLNIHRLIKEDGERQNHHHQNDDDPKERIPDGSEIEPSALLVSRSAIYRRSCIRDIQRKEANRRHRHRDAEDLPIRDPSTSSYKDELSPVESLRKVVG